MASPVSSMALQTASEHTSVLVEGKLLSGNDLFQYAQQKGLCPKCVQHATHKKVKKRLGMLRSVTPDWIPITQKDENEGNYTVYKGFCLQPTCWTLSEVQAILGEASTHRAQSVGRQRGSQTPVRSRPSETPCREERPRRRASLSTMQNECAPVDRGHLMERSVASSSRDLDCAHRSRSNIRDSYSSTEEEAIRRPMTRTGSGEKRTSRMGLDAHHKGNQVSIRGLNRSDIASDEMSVGSQYSNHQGDSGNYIDRNSIRSVTTKPTDGGLDVSRSRHSSSSRELGRASLSSRSSRHLDNFLDAAMAATQKSPYVRRSVLDLSASERSPASFYSRQSESDSDDEGEFSKQAGNINASGDISVDPPPVRRILSPQGSMRSSISSKEPILRRPSFSHGPSPSSLDKSTRNRLAECRLTSSSVRDLRPITGILRGSSHSGDGSNRHIPHTPSRRRYSITNVEPRSPLDLPSRITITESRSSCRDLKHNNESKRRLPAADEMNVLSRFNHLRESSFREASPNRHLVDTGSRHSLDDENFTSTSPVYLYDRQEDENSLEDEDETKEYWKLPASNSNARQRWSTLSHGLAAANALSKNTNPKKGEDPSHSVAERGSNTIRQPSQQSLVPHSPSMDRVVMRRAVPDLDILQQLCHICLEKDSKNAQRSSIDTSAENLWTSLHTRYGDNALPSSSCRGKASTLVYLLEQTDNTECIESCWALLSHTTKQDDWVNHDVADLDLKILNRIAVEFNRQDVDFLLTKHIGETMCNLIEAETLSANNVLTDWLQSMPSDLRYQWIAILFNAVFVGDNQRHDNNEMLPILSVISVLIELLALDVTVRSYSSESQQLFEGLASLAVTILTAECKVSIDKDNEKDYFNKARLSKTSLSILASAASLGTGSSLRARSVECISLILDAMQKHTTSSVIYQGVLAARHVCCRIIDDIDSTDCVSFAEKVVEIAMMTLMFEKQNASLLLALEGCHLVTLLLEKQHRARRAAENSLVLQQPVLVETIVHIVDTSEEANSTDEGLRMLFILVTKHPMSGRNLRQTRNIASKLVGWLEKRNDSSSAQQYICLIVEQLVSSEDHMLGQEIGHAGGLCVLSSLVESSAQERKVFEAASRSLVGVIAVVEKALLFNYKAQIVRDVASAMGGNPFSLELQMAGLNILHCLCLATDSELGQNDLVVPITVKSMENHFGNVDLLTRCCTIIRMIASKLVNWTVIIEAGGAKRIINAMLVHPVSTQLVLEGMATIKDLAAKESFRDHFSLEDAELAVVSALPVHSRNPEVLSFAFATLNNIAVDTRSQKVAQMNVDVFHFILSALTDFSDDFRVARNACLLLKSYTYEEGNLNMMRSFHSALMPCLRLLSESSNSEIRERVQYIINKI